MKKTAKLLALLLALLMTIACFASCGGEDSKDDSDNDNDSANSDKTAETTQNSDNQSSNENKAKYDQAATLISQNKIEEAYTLLKSISAYEPAQEKLKNFFYAPKTVTEKWKSSDDTDYRSTSSITYTYNSMGNILETSEGLIFTYDADGNVLSGCDLVYESNYYTYVYQDGKLYQQIRDDSYTETYHYNDKGLVSKLESSNGGSDTYIYTYYENENVKTMRINYSSVSFEEYSYDENGNITKVVYTCPSNYGPSDTINYTYGEYGITRLDLQNTYDEAATFTYSYNESGILTNLEVKEYRTGRLHTTYVITFSDHQLCYSENPQVQERIAIVCYTDLSSALEIVY
jgi:hypothetical protein